MDHHGGWAATVGPAVDEPGRWGPADPDRVDLTRLLGGLRHLSASPEPARVFAELATVCVPALCDQCLIQITEQDRCPYRIWQGGPAISIPAWMTDAEVIAALAGRGGVLDGHPAGGAVVEAGDRTVVARFASPPGTHCGAQRLNSNRRKLFQAPVIASTSPHPSPDAIHPAGRRRTLPPPAATDPDRSARSTPHRPCIGAPCTVWPPLVHRQPRPPPHPGSGFRRSAHDPGELRVQPLLVLADQRPELRRLARN